MAKVDKPDVVKVHGSDIARTVAVRTGLTQAQAAEAMRVGMEVIAERLVAGKTVQFKQLGVFGQTVTKARVGRNPKTGEPIQIKEKRRITYRCSRRLKESINPSDTKK